MLAAASWLIGHWNASRVDSRIRAELGAQAVSIAAAAEAPSPRGFRFDEEDYHNPVFQRVHRQLKDYLPVTGARSIYTMAERGGQYVFGPESCVPGTDLHAPPGTPFLHPPPELAGAFGTLQPVVAGPYTDEYGTWLSAFAPIQDQRTGAGSDGRDGH